MDIKKILSQMTLEEKASLCQGANFWHTVAVERLGVPSIMVTDGPHGLRKQADAGDHLGITDSVEAICFPTAAGMACSFDPELIKRMGNALGEECQAENVSAILGPAANIKRSPLCGRNFEYFSEDPLLSGKMAAAYIQGVQEKGVGTSLKHFAANNQETRRMSVSERISDRALMEIYLASFEEAVKGGKPWTVMCSYNKINGTYSSENPWLLTDVLRKEWGFDGIVVTDWGACNDHVKGVEAGLELEMPRSGDEDDMRLVEAVHSGKLPESVLDQAAERMLTLIDRCLSQKKKDAAYDKKEHHQKARELGREAMVLLKNEDHLLPLNAAQKIAFIGAFAKKPRYQGGGSSHIHVSEELSALEAVKELCNVEYAEGFRTDTTETDTPMLEKAIETAKQADVAVLFLGLPDSFESEGYDRTHLNLPECQNELVKAIAKVQKNIVVVLHNGAPVTMPWLQGVPAVLEAYLGGQAVGGSVVDLLFGKASPCGKLAETFPLRIEDTPAYLNFPGVGDHVTYAEDIFVGYRYYDKKKLDVLFPFGHGLTYTTFSYDSMNLSKEEFSGEPISVTVEIANTGSFAAKETVQIYVRPESEEADRPVHELKGFEKILLQPGESGKVQISLDRRAFARWDEESGRWFVKEGRYVIEAAASSRDIRLSKTVYVHGGQETISVSADTTIGDLQRIPGAMQILSSLLKKMDIFASMSEENSLGDGTGEMVAKMMEFLPLHALPSFAQGQITRTDIDELVKKLQDLSSK